MTDRRIIGVDEAGRGPLAGPVVVAAVILSIDNMPQGLGDSKALSATKRQRLFSEVKARALAFHIEFISPARIDEINILQATLEGMRKAIAAIADAGDLALIDGNQLPDNLICPAQALVKGDSREPSIMAASILAKVARDHYALQMHERFPAYGFNQHKGYPTASHLEILRQIGPCEEHRRSFAPVRSCLTQAEMANRCGQ